MQEQVQSKQKARRLARFCGAEPRQRSRVGSSRTAAAAAAVRQRDPVPLVGTRGKILENLRERERERFMLQVSWRALVVFELAAPKNKFAGRTSAREASGIVVAGKTTTTLPLFAGDIHHLLSCRLIFPGQFVAVAAPQVAQLEKPFHRLGFQRVGSASKLNGMF